MSKPIVSQIAAWFLVLWLSHWSAPLQAQFMRPHVYVGASVGGGLSAIMNQNNYGFP